MDSVPNLRAVGAEHRKAPSIISLDSDSSDDGQIRQNQDNLFKQERTESPESSFTVSSDESSHSSDSDHDHSNSNQKVSRKKRRFNSFCKSNKSLYQNHCHQRKRRANLWDLKDENISLNISSITEALDKVSAMKQEVMTAYTESSESVKQELMTDSLFAVEDSLKVVEQRVNGMNALEGQIMSVQAELRTKKFEKTLQTKLLNNDLFHIERSLENIADIRSQIQQIRMQSHQINIKLKMEKKKQCKNMLLEINKELNLSTKKETKQEASSCIICEENVNDMVCVPCGHRYCCQKCVEEQGKPDKCAICMKDVTMVIRTYNSGSSL